MKALLPFLVIVFLLSCPSGSSAQSIKLMLEKGDRFEITTTSKNNVSSKLMGVDSDYAVNSTFVEAIEVVRTSDAEYELSSTVTRIAVNLKSKEQNGSYDSTRNDNEPKFAEEFGKTPGKVRSLTVNANGKITKEVPDPTAEASSAITFFPASSFVLGMLRESLIGKEMTVKKSWETTSSDKIGNTTTTTKGTYSVIAIEDNVATVSFVGTQQVNGSLTNSGVTFVTSGSNKLNDQLKIDMISGIVLETVSTVEELTAIDVDGLVIPITSKSIVTSKVRVLR